VVACVVSLLGKGSEGSKGNGIEGKGLSIGWLVYYTSGEGCV
jgi:hypothetical protein